METILVNNFSFIVTRWNLEKQFENEKFILPLINSPIVTSMSVGNDQELVLPAIVSGLLDALAGADLKTIMQVFLQDVIVTPPGKVQQIATLQSLHAAGFDLADCHELLVELVLLQYGALLKKGLQGTLTRIMSSLMPESKPSTNE